MKYEFLEHTADLKIRASGKSLANAFENIGLGLEEYICRGGKVEGKIKKEFSLKGEDNEALLYSFLDEIIFLLDTEAFIFSKIKVKIKKGELKAEMKGDDAGNYLHLNPPKAATYAEMYVKRTKKGFEVQAVIDV